MKVDLHLHSIYSEHPSDWFLKRIGAGESYSKPKFIYQLAKDRGMDYVTITDHNRIDGILKLMEKYPDDTFMGIESTAYFPEDGCKVHLLIWGFKEKHFQKIEKHRKNIYDLRDYVREKGFAYSVAHLNYSINGKLTLEHIEKLILLFDVFEAVNGYRSHRNNRAIYDTLSNLNPSHIDRLQKKHRIEPFSSKAWIKGFTGGSDDSAGLYIGKTYTSAEAQSKDDFLKQIINKNTRFEGRSNNFKSLAMTVYKVAWDYSQHKSEKLVRNFFTNVNEIIFEPSSLSFINRLKLRGYHATIKEDDLISQKIIGLIEKLEKNPELDPDKRFDVVYQAVSDLSDEILKGIVTYLTTNISNLDIISAFGKLSQFLPAVFMAAPFVTAFNHLFKDRDLSHNLLKSFDIIDDNTEKKILWFTDTIHDLNGVSVTLREFAWWAYNNNKQVKLVISVVEDEAVDSLPPNVIVLQNILNFKAPYYERYTMMVPSLLDSLSIIHDEDPDEIYISTPGFIGLLGLICSKLLHIKSLGIFHTDFQSQLDWIAYEDDTVSGKIEWYLSWFYSTVDKVAVPSVDYGSKVMKYGVDASKVKLFKRWINTNKFKPNPEARNLLNRKYDLDGKQLLLYTGRISQDKNIDFLIEIIRQFNSESSSYSGKLALMICGDGPYLPELRKKTGDIANLILTGAIPHDELPDYYASADLFLFPSETDTFGMSVLEAQSSGTPCIVTEIGGPKEIILNNQSGFSLPTNIELWIRKISLLLDLSRTNDTQFNLLRDYARNRALNDFGIENVLAKEFITDL